MLYFIMIIQTILLIPDWYLRSHKRCPKLVEGFNVTPSPIPSLSSLTSLHSPSQVLPFSHSHVFPFPPSHLSLLSSHPLPFSSSPFLIAIGELRCAYLPVGRLRFSVLSVSLPTLPSGRQVAGRSVVLFGFTQTF